MRSGRWAKAAGVIVASVALVGTTAASAEAKAGAARATRTYAVGSHSYTFVDKTRRTNANGTYPGAPTRTLPTLLLYPAQGAPGSPTVKDAKPIRSRRGFPLIVFSHGVGASGPAYQFLLERYVRQGYVVAAPTFPLSKGGAPGGSSIGDYVNQPADVSFVLSQVLSLARHRSSGLRDTIDRHDIGVAGHSLGAITTLGLTNSCCSDRRIDAALALSGIQLPFPGGSFFAKKTPPLMLVHGNKDGTVPYAGSVNAYAQAPGPKAFMTLDGAPHVFFTSPWLDPAIRATTDFLDGYLKHDRKALRRLAGDGTVPGVSSVQTSLKRGSRR